MARTSHPAIDARATKANAMTHARSPCAYRKPHTHGLSDRSAQAGGRRTTLHARGGRDIYGWGRPSDLPPAAAHRARFTDAGRPWRASGRAAVVAVVEAAHVRPRDDLPRASRLDGAADGRILAQREMRAPEMIVVDVRSQYSLE